MESKRKLKTSKAKIRSAKEARRISNKRKSSRNIKKTSRSESTCSSVSVNSTCMANLKNSMKYDRDTITNFKNQLERSKNFDKLVGE